MVWEIDADPWRPFIKINQVAMWSQSWPASWGVSV